MRSLPNRTGFFRPSAISSPSVAPAQAFAEAHRVYAKIGAADKLSMFEADDGHGYTHPRRMAGYEWFARWLKGEEDKRPEPEIQLATFEDLQCTPSGQVVDLPDAETVFSLNRKRARADPAPSRFRRTTCAIAFAS